MGIALNGSTGGPGGDRFGAARRGWSNRRMLRAADAVHWRDAMLRSAERTGSRLRALADVLVARQRSAVAAATALRGPSSAAPSGRPRTLRVLHVMDARNPDGGRLVISGRMADVCAELDRLAAREARHLRC